MAVISQVPSIVAFRSYTDAHTHTHTESQREGEMRSGKDQRAFWRHTMANKGHFGGKTDWEEDRLCEAAAYYHAPMADTWGRSLIFPSRPDRRLGLRRATNLWFIRFDRTGLAITWRSGSFDHSLTIIKE